MVPFISMKPQLFILSSELIKSASWKEIEATYKDMVELEIANPPYQDLDLSCPASAIFSDKDQQWFLDRLRLNKDQLEKGFRVIIEVRNGNVNGSYVFGDSQYFKKGIQFVAANTMNEHNKSVHTQWLQTLIVFLASKGVERKNAVDKLAKLGIGKNKNRHIYTTSLSLGKALSNKDSANPTKPGVEKRPHLRRGHIRCQHYGPGNELLKRLWIDPVFVNGYSEEIDLIRTAYNVSS